MKKTKFLISFLCLLFLFSGAIFIIVAENKPIAAQAASYKFLVFDHSSQISVPEEWHNWFEIRVYRQDGRDITRSSNVITDYDAINFYPRIALFSKDIPSNTVGPSNANEEAQHCVVFNWHSNASTSIADNYIKVNQGTSTIFQTGNNPFDYDAIHTTMGMFERWRMGRIVQKEINLGNVNTEGNFSLEGQLYLNAIRYDRNEHFSNWGHTITFKLNFVIDTKEPVLNFSPTFSQFFKSNVTVTFDNSSSGYTGSPGKSYDQDKLTPLYSVNKQMSNASYPSSGSTFSFSSGLVLSEEGHYAVTIKDRAENINTKLFTIDKTAPKLSLTKENEGELANGGYTNKNVVVAWSTSKGLKENMSNSDDILTVKYAKSSSGNFPSVTSTAVINGNIFTEEGNYLLDITDKARNITSYKFTIDRTAPHITNTNGVKFSTSGTLKEENFTTSSVIVSWAETLTSIKDQKSNAADILSVTYSQSLTGNFPSTSNINVGQNKKFNDSGNYRISICDSAGNKQDYFFTIDKSAPTFSLQGIDNNGFTKAYVNVSWSNDYTNVTSQKSNPSDILEVKYSVSQTGNFPSSASTAITNNFSFTAVGNYYVEIKDNAKNSSFKTFTIDKTAPALTFTNVLPNGFTNSTVSADWKLSYSTVDDQKANALDGLTAFYDYSNSKNFPSASTKPYSAKTPLSLEGNYRIELFDKAGNKSIYYFTIDKTAPIGLLKTANGQALDQNRTNQNVCLSWSKDANTINENDSISAVYGYSAYEKPTTIDLPYTADTFLSNDGFYVIYLIDKSKNIKEYSFVIDKRPPNFDIVNEGFKVVDKSSLFFNFNVKIVSNNNIITVNNKEYSGEFLINEGVYAVKIVDVLGNFTNFSLSIIKTLPDANFKRLRNTLNSWYETVTPTNSFVSFASYDKIYAYADNRERSKIIYGTWVADLWDGGVPIAPSDISFAQKGLNYYIYTANDNANKQYAYFSLDSLNKAISGYVNESIKQKYIPSNPAPAAPNEKLFQDIYYSKSSIEFKLIPNCVLYINGNAVPYPYVLTLPGIHTVKEIDKAGNSITYTVIIDSEVPLIKKTNLNGNNTETLRYGVTNYFDYAIKITLSDIDKNALLIIDGVVYSGQSVELKEGRTYTVSTRDAAGNVGNLSICISLNSPTIIISENTVNDIVNSFSVNVYKNSNLNVLTNLSILKLNQELGIWNSLQFDNSATPVSININNLSYTFSVSGDYKIIVIDVFGRRLEKEMTFFKDAPKGTIYSSLGDILTSGAFSKNNVYFTWSSKLDCSATISGGEFSNTPYIKGTTVTKEGAYTIILKSNLENISNTYTFSIDKTPPSGALFANGLPLAEGAATKENVTFLWTENNCTATLNGLPYVNGTNIAENGTHTIVLTDNAGNKISYSFTIKFKPPVGVLTTSQGNLSSNETTKFDVYFSWSEAKCSATLNGVNYERFSKISLEGSYIIILTDAVGNTSSYFFTIDKTPPSGKLMINDTEAENNVLTNKSVYFTWTENNCSAIINNQSLYEKNTLLTQDGIYTIVLSDIAGNTRTYTFTIKTAKPLAKIYANGVIIDSGSRTRYAIRLSWTENATCTVNGNKYNKNENLSGEGNYVFVLTDAFGNQNTFNCSIDKTAPKINVLSNGNELQNSDIVNFDVYIYWEKDNCKATLNGNDYLSGSLISNDLEYFFTVTDDVGNSTDFHFIIDKKAKLGTLVSNGKVIDNNSISRFDVYFTWSDKKCQVFLNDVSYTKGTVVKNEGEYNVLLIDAAGNKSFYFFIIDKTAPEFSAYTSKDDSSFIIENNFKGNSNVYFTWTEKDCSATLNGNVYEKDTFITENGEYSFIIFDKSGNSKIFNFTINKTPPKINVFTSSNVSLGDNYFTRFNIYFSWSEKNCTALVNNEIYSINSVINSSGVYNILLMDSFGNVSALCVTIEKSLPEILILNLDNEQVLKDFFNDGFYISWDGEYLATINGKSYTKNAIIEDIGEYTITLINKFGSSSIIIITIDKIPPVVNIINDKDNSIDNGGVSINYFYFTWEKEGCTALLNNEPYTKSTFIYNDGNYTLVITDKAGNTAIFKASLYRAKPILFVYNSETNEKVSLENSLKFPIFLKSNDNRDIISINNKSYVYGSEIKEYGNLYVEVINVYGNKSSYNILLKDPAQAEAQKNPLENLLKGSDVSSVLFCCASFIIVVVFIVVPFINTKILRKNPYKKRLK